MMPTPAGRFLALARLGEPDECWEWSGRREANGYGRFRFDGRAEWAHRVSWLLFRGPIPAGNDVCHRCDNRGCVNPGHLFTGTRAENMADAAAKGRTLRGERNGSARLTEERVRLLRGERGVTHVELARRYGVSPSAVRLILRRERWAHVA